MKSSSGIGLALGALAALTAAASLRSSVRQAGSACVQCGQVMGGVGSRNTPDSTTLSPLMDFDPFLDKRRKELRFMSSSFYVQRLEARSWFRMKLSEAEIYVRDRKDIVQKAQARALRAMGATEDIRFDTGLLSPSHVSGVLDWQSTEFVRLLDEQRRDLHEIGVDRLAVGPDGRLFNCGISTAQEYIDTKKDTIKRFMKTSSWKSKYPNSAVLASLYGERSWTAYFLKSSGFDSRDSRKPIAVPTFGAGQKSVLDGLTFRLCLPGTVPEVDGKGFCFSREDKDGRPGIIFFDGEDRISIFNVTDNGTMNTFARGRTLVPVFSATSKMSAPSFSLPAGNPRVAGTCIMAAVEPQRGYTDAQTICNVCYATSANYGYPESMGSNHIRKMWVEQSLKKGNFVEEMTAAISAYARYSKQGGYSESKDVDSDEESSGTRRSLELGVWENSSKKIRLPSPDANPQYADNTRIRFASDLKLPFKDTRSYFVSKNLNEGQVCGFLRIHDAGDFTTRNMVAYIRSWGEVARRLPGVQFWAPTRVWAEMRSPDALTPAQRDWLDRQCASGAKMGLGSRSTPSDRPDPSVRDIIHDSLPLGVPPVSTDRLEDSVSPVEPPTTASPGDAAMLHVKPNLVYVPGTRVSAFVDAVRGASNFVIRPSSIYVKTPHNLASVPTIPGMANGSGVNVKWGSFLSWPKEIEERVKEEMSKLGHLTESQITNASKKAVDNALKNVPGVSKIDYVPVFDGQGEKAYQCPVYSLLPPQDASRTDDSGGTVKMKEAKSCMAAGCRACWLSPRKPITYGYH